MVLVFVQLNATFSLHSCLMNTPPWGMECKVRRCLSGLGIDAVIYIVYPMCFWFEIAARIVDVQHSSMHV
uniref:Uncharacterized protein n=1 Tax=Aegilops tauschii subsp. strangulata TaxID=200361 RepID=A0A453KVF5_AEGTS